ncbi:phosphatase PAP2 family protein [Dermacoccaceae bacterium W4C1]
MTGETQALTPERQWWATWAGPAAWAIAFAVYCSWYGVPAGRDLITLWILLGLVAFSIGRGWSTVWRLVRDWVPVLAFLYAYDLLRGYSDAFTPHVTPQIDADRFMFGGHIPTVWLQDHLWHPPDIAWYDWLVTVNYLTHFVATLFVGVVLWGRFYRLFPRYMVQLVTLTAAGLATYAAFPAVPPWLAGQDGVIPPVDRVVYQSLRQLPMVDFGDLITDRGPEYANDVAAMPSMHAAMPMLICAFFWPMVHRWWGRALLLAYPLSMGFTLVYAGEHYVIDVLVGFAYALIVNALGTLFFRWWHQRRDARAQAQARVVDAPASRRAAAAQVSTAAAPRTSTPAENDQVEAAADSSIGTKKPR